MLDKIKEWAEEIIVLLNQNDRDNFIMKIKSNRERIRLPLIRAKVLAAQLPVATIPVAVKIAGRDAIVLLEDYYYYFDEGYVPVSGKSIDTLRYDCTEALEKLILAIEGL